MSIRFVLGLLVALNFVLAGSGIAFAQSTDKERSDCMKMAFSKTVTNPVYKLDSQFCRSYLKDMAEKSDKYAQVLLPRLAALGITLDLPADFGKPKLYTVPKVSTSNTVRYLPSQIAPNRYEIGWLHGKAVTCVRIPQEGELQIKLSQPIEACKVRR